MNLSEVIFKGYVPIVLSWLFPILTLFFAAFFEPDIQIGVLLLLLLAIVVGMLIPGVVISWLIIVLTTVGAGILLFGYLVIPVNDKVILLLAFPIEGTLVNLVSDWLLKWRSLGPNITSIHRYREHYNLDTKLLTGHNAEKVYSKEITAIKSYPSYNLFMNITEIHWQNWQQYRQFHSDNQREILHNISREIKHTRLPSELIYYLGDARFLIISYRVDEKTQKTINDATQKNLQQAFKAPAIQFKWAMQQINYDNYDRFTYFADIYKHLDRVMETDIITEYSREEN
ncbi:hypothetical protein [Lactiplantibacillus fabifermentans]|uniref:GGDEF domain-containing protein n=1 Tax=Lactiplantibacillus fabifermentans DSM 21115 TaxID=1413187 RepID=A0A0R2P0T8_9LACO|nr:hypothetical protein [Lactiplantibacillus fabifermentans]KRO29299.1 hypothetical protein DY78_GL001039 [Lactiplantibacillus fabifermentans DSM 21115]